MGGMRLSFSETALSMRKESDLNCCQSVLGAASDACGLDSRTACRLGAFFGSGMRQGEVCGCVSAVLMALGTKYGDENNRQCRVSKEFMAQFKEKYGSLLCRELIRRNGRPICDQLIAYAADYLEEQL